MIRLIVFFSVFISMAFFSLLCEQSRLCIIFIRKDWSDSRGIVTCSLYWINKFAIEIISFLYSLVDLPWYEKDASRNVSSITFVNNLQRVKGFRLIRSRESCSFGQHELFGDKMWHISKMFSFACDWSRYVAWPSIT